MSKVLDKSWKKLLVAFVVFLFVGFAARQGVTAQPPRSEASHKAHHETGRKKASSAEAKKPKKDPKALGGCSESVEEISESYNECKSEGCACGTWTPP